MPVVTVASVSHRVRGVAQVAPADLARLGPPAVVAALVALYSGVFGHLTWRQHANWRTFGFDAGIYDQGMWLLSQGREPFMTIRGMDFWGHHVTLISALFVPVYWLGGGIQAVGLIHTIWWRRRPCPSDSWPVTAGGGPSWPWPCPWPTSCTRPCRG